MSAMGLMATLGRHWFLLGLGLALLLGALAPGIGASGGPLHPEWSVHAAVGLSFLVSGLAMPGSQLVASLGRWRLHLFVQAMGFIVAPLLVLALRPALAGAGMPTAVGQGFVVLACLPTTIASCAILTRAAGGDEAAALFNAVAGNLLGLGLTPALLLLLLGATGEAPVARILQQLALEVLAPLLAGQLAQRCGGAPVARLAKALKPLPTLMIIFIFYTVICATTAERDLATVGQALACTLAAALALHLAMLALCWWGSAMPALGLERGERIAAMFCASQKTLAIGAPMIAIMHRQDAALGLIMLPIIAYHPLQLLVDGVLAGRLRRQQPS
jgi:sodium/bile acid cotransporter 7